MAAPRLHGPISKYIVEVQVGIRDFSSWVVDRPVKAHASTALMPTAHLFSMHRTSIQGPGDWSHVVEQMPWAAVR